MSATVDSRGAETRQTNVHSSGTVDAQSPPRERPDAEGHAAGRVAGRQLPQACDQLDGALDRVDVLAWAADVGRPAPDLDLHPEHDRGRDERVEPGAFGDHRAVGVGRVAPGRERAVARAFLFDHGFEADSASQRDLGLADGFERPQRGDEAALHVPAAAAVQPAADDPAAPRILRPPADGLRAHHVDVAVQDEAAAAAAAGRFGDHVGTRHVGMRHGREARQPAQPIGVDVADGGREPHRLQAAGDEQLALPLAAEHGRRGDELREEGLGRVATGFDGSVGASLELGHTRLSWRP